MNDTLMYDFASRRSSQTDSLPGLVKLENNQYLEANEHRR